MGDVSLSALHGHKPKVGSLPSSEERISLSPFFLSPSLFQPLMSCAATLLDLLYYIKKESRLELLCLN